MHIACLHTAESNVAVFDAATDGLDVALVHSVRADLLAAAEAAGALTDAIAAETSAVLSGLAGKADAVVLTCSTLGPSVERLGALPVLRADAALAEQAVAHGGRVVVLCAVATTIGPTTALFEAAATKASPRPALDVRLVAGAWDLFKAGQIADYHALLAAEADRALAAGAGVVALAQASMAGAADLATRGPVLSSPRAALAAARARGARGA